MDAGGTQIWTISTMVDSAEVTLLLTVETQHGTLANTQRPSQFNWSISVCYFGSKSATISSIWLPWKLIFM